MGANLYRIDDLLLRAGWASLVLLVLAGIALVLIGVGSGEVLGVEPGPRQLGRVRALILLAALCPATLLGAGVVLRRQERRIFSVWQLLRQNAVLSVPELLANSDLGRGDVERSVRFLNNRGHAHYVWDRAHDTIRDGRLRGSHVLVEKCEGCGAAIQLEIALAANDAAKCPYCQAPLSSEDARDRDREAIETLRAEFRTLRHEADAATRFSPLLFFLLLGVFWPAGLAYAWFVWRGEH